MILTCPECATSYFVDDGRIPPAGRTVKCANCGARWTATPEAAPPAAPEPAPPVFEAGPVQAVVSEPEPVVEAVEAEPEPALRRRPAARPAAPKSAGKGKVVAISVAAVLVAAVIAAALIFRADVVRMLPASGPAYAGLGLPVAGAGLVIEDVKAAPSFQGGKPVLAVTGAIRNIGAQAASAPPIRIRLLNRAGRPVAAKIATPLNDEIPAKGVRRFSVAIVDPPSTARDLDVQFEGARPKDAKPAVAEHAAPHGEAEAGLAPEEAKPIPPGAPDALPEHHG